MNRKPRGHTLRNGLPEPDARSIYLLVSDPPHREPDYAEVARLLRLSQAEARMKEHFPAPEVWQTYETADEARRARDGFRGAGMSVVALSGEQIGDIPVQSTARTFEFDDSGLSVTVEEEQLFLPYDQPIVGVSCRPAAGFTDRRAPRKDSFGRRSTAVLLDRTVAHDRRRPYGGIADDLERSAFLDIYVRSASGAPTRITIASNFADFTGLGSLMKVTSIDNVSTCVSLCEERFTGSTIDRRLEDVRPRQRLPIGRPSPDGRRLLSFGTGELNEVLDAARPGLHELTQFELGSRVAYLIASAKQRRG